VAVPATAAGAAAVVGVAVLRCLARRRRTERKVTMRMMIGIGMLNIEASQSDFKKPWS